MLGLHYMCKVQISEATSLKIPFQPRKVNKPKISFNSETTAVFCMWYDVTTSLNQLNGVSA